MTQTFACADQGEGRGSHYLCNPPRHSACDRVVRTVVVALLSMVALACTRQRADPPKARAATTPATGVATSPAPAPTAAAPPSDAEPQCNPQDVESSKLARSWPTLVGRQVRLRCRVDRMVDMTDAIVVAGKERFVVMLAPSDAWDGLKTKAFTVTGSRTVRLNGGSVTLPELVIADECEQ